MLILLTATENYFVNYCLVEDSLTHVQQTMKIFVIATSANCKVVKLIYHWQNVADMLPEALIVQEVNLDEENYSIFLASYLSEQSSLTPLVKLHKNWISSPKAALQLVVSCPPWDTAHCEQNDGRLSWLIFHNRSLLNS